MNVCVCILSTGNPNKIKDNYEKIAAKFRDINPTLKVEQAVDIYTLKEQVSKSGSKYEKIILVVLSLDGYDKDNLSDCITELVSYMGSTQSVSICDTDEVIVPYLSETFITYPNTFINAKPDKKTPACIYNAVFGGEKTVVSKQTISEIENVIKADNQRKEDTVMPAPVLVDDNDNMVEDMTNVAPVAEVQVPAQETEKGFGKKILGLFKKKTRDDVVNMANGNEVGAMPAQTFNNDDMPAPVGSDDIPAPIGDSEPEPVIMSEPKPMTPSKPKPLAPLKPNRTTTAPTSTPVAEPTDSFGTVHESVNSFSDVDSDDDVVPTFDDNMFTTSDTDSMSGYDSGYADDYNRPEEVMPAPTPNVAPAPAPEAPVQDKKGFGFGKKNKIKLPKADKSGISMQKRPRLVFVTGTGRIGQSTLVASLGFTAAQYMCTSLVVDMDLIRRAQSCIYSDYSNPNSNESIGLISAIRSPALVDEIASEQYTRVYTLGLSITAGDNREIMTTFTNIELQTMLLSALTKFNLVVVDMPWEYMMQHPEIISIPHDILFTTSNDIMTMISDLNQLSEDAFEKPEHYQMLMSKLRFVLNMTSEENHYQNKKITEKNFTDVCYLLTEQEMFTTIPVVANIPFLPNIGNQVVLGKPASSYSEGFAAYCGQILHELN